MHTETGNLSEQPHDSESGLSLAKGRMILSADLQVPKDPLDPFLYRLFEQLPAERRTPQLGAAASLYLHGFNVFPQPEGRKGGWPWKPLQYTRMHPILLPTLFEFYCNFAVMMGRTSGNLFVIDCETQDTFEQQGELLRKNNIPIFAALTNGLASGGHYYLRAANGEVENIRSGTIDDLEVRGSRCYVLAPPSIHPHTGRFYEWLERETAEPPVIDIRQIDWLPLKVIARQRSPKRENYLTSLHGSEEFLAVLSRKTIDFIYFGAPEGTRNNRLFTALCDMIGNDIDETLIESTLIPAAERSGLDYQEIRSTFKSAYSRRREPARKSLPVAAQPQKWEQALRWAQHHKWTGRTGQSDRATFVAMCERAKLYCTDRGTFRASTRELAELSQLSRATVSKSINRLLAAGYILGSGYDADTRARMYQFAQFKGESWRECTSVYTWSSQQWPNHARFFSQNFARNDAFERNALGKTAALVWQSLAKFQKAAKPKIIAEACNLSIDQVYRALRKLDEYKLVSKQKRGWAAIVVDGHWLNENVAAAAGTRGRMEKRKTKHQVERALHAGWSLADQLNIYERKYYKALVESQGLE